MPGEGSMRLNRSQPVPCAGEVGINLEFLVGRIPAVAGGRHAVSDRDFGHAFIGEAGLLHSAGRDLEQDHPQIFDRKGEQVIRIGNNGRQRLNRWFPDRSLRAGYLTKGASYP
jgi:hypothetical protein